MSLLLRHLATHTEYYNPDPIKVVSITFNSTALSLTNLGLALDWEINEVSKTLIMIALISDLQRS